MLLFAGDPHGDFSHLFPILTQYDHPSLILLGDLEVKNPKILDQLSQLCDLWYIHGNHDSKRTEFYETLWGKEWQKRNLHGRVKTICGIRVAGLGGVFRGKIWMPPNKPLFLDPIHYCQFCSQEKLWRGGLPLRHRTSIFPSDFEALQSLQADILVSHEAPLPHPSGFIELNHLAEKIGVSQIVHGHHHENYRYKNHSFNYHIYNVGFRSLMTKNGVYLIENQNDRP